MTKTEKEKYKRWLRLLWILVAQGSICILFALPARADQFRISHYCACEKCCGKSDGITASGKKVQEGHTIACNWLKFGTKVKIGSKTYVVEDRGAKSIFGTIKNPKKAIDIYCASHREALNKGVYYAKVEIL